MNAKPDSSSHVRPVEAIIEEVLDRLRKGDRPTLAEYLSRHPDLAEELRAVLPALLAVEQLKPATNEATGPYSPGDGQESKPLERLGDYRILRQVGRGGMGIVYEAEQVSLGRHVALKILPAQSLLDPQRLQRFEREARAAARLHHTNIVPVYGVGCDQGLHYYAMQFIHGHALDVVIGELRRLRDKPGTATAEPVSRIASQLHSGRSAAPVANAPGSPDLTSRVDTPVAPGSTGLSESGRAYWQSVARLGIQAAQALAYAHGQGVLHRDVKPSNLLLDLHGTVWITDFGLAKSSDSDDLTGTGDVVGTIRYLAPERFHGQADGRSDVYALGLTLYELLTLRPAFPDSDRQRLMRQVLAEEPAPPRRLAPAIPRDLETIVLKSIARDPGQRYQSAADLADDLQRFVDDRPIQARRITQTERLWRWCRRNPVMAGLAAALVLALLGATVFALLHARTADNLAQSRTEQARIAEEGRRESERLIARQHIARATRLIEQGNLAEATLWNLAALQVDQNDPERAEQHRIRLGLLLRQCPRPTHIFFHGGKVTDTAFSPDGKLLATACEDGRVRVWDWVRGLEVCPQLVHAQRVLRIAFSPDGRRLLSVAGPRGSEIGATITDDRPGPVRKEKLQVRVWDVKTGAALTPELPHVESIQYTGFCQGGRGVLTAPDGNSLQVHDAGTGQATDRQLSADVVAGRTLRLDPNGGHVVLHSMSPLPSRRERMGEPPLPRTPPPGDVQLWNLETGRLQTLVRATACYSGGIAFSPDSRHVVVVYNDRAHVHDTATGQQVATYAPDEPVNGQVPTFSADGRQILSYVFPPAGRSNAWAQVWETATGKPLSPLLATMAIGPGPKFSPDARSLLLYQNNGDPVLVKVRTGQVQARFAASAEGDDWQVSSPDGRFVAVFNPHEGVRIHGTHDGQAVSPWLNHEGVLSHRTYSGSVLFEFTPDGSHLLTGVGNTVRLWPVAGSEPARTGAMGPGSIVTAGRVEMVFLSPDGKRLVVVANPAAPSRDFHSTLRTWNTDTGIELHPPLRMDFQVLSGHFSSDGRFLFLDRDEGIPGEAQLTNHPARILETGTGRLLPLEEPDPRPDFVHGFLNYPAMAFRPDGQYLLTGMGIPGMNIPGDLKQTKHVDELRLWRTATGQRVGAVLRLDGLRSACWSPDGRHVLTSAAVGNRLQVCLWFCPNGEDRVEWEKVRAFEGSAVKSVVGPNSGFGFPILSIPGAPEARFSDDGQRVLLFTLSDDSTLAVRIWNAHSGAQLVSRSGTVPYAMIPTDVQISSNGQYLVSARAEAVELVHLGPDRVLHLPGPALQHGVPQVVFAPDSGRFLVAGEKSVSLYDSKTGDLLVPSLVHAEPLAKVAFSADGRRILTVSTPRASWHDPVIVARGQTCSVWDAATGQPLTPPLRGAPKTGMGIQNAETVAWDASGQRLAIPDAANRVRIHDLTAEPRPVPELLHLVEAFTRLRINAAGTVQPLARAAFEETWKDVRQRYAGEWEQSLVVGPAWHRHVLASLNVGLCLDPSFSAEPRSEAFAMLWHNERLLREQPNDARLLEDRALGLSWLRNWEQLLREQRPGWMQSRALAELGRWQEALTELEQTRKHPDEERNGSDDQALALLYLKVGNIPAYEKMCRRLLEASKAEGLSRRISFSPWPCILRPGMDADWEQLAKWKPVSDSTRDYVGENTLVRAGVMYRLGRHKEVVRLLTADGPRSSAQNACQCFLLAMALKHVAGQEARAREMLALGIDRMRTSHDPDDESDDWSITPRWKRRLAEEFLHREAEEVVRGKQ